MVTFVASAVSFISRFGIATKLVPGIDEHPYILVNVYGALTGISWATDADVALGNVPKFMTFLKTFLYIGLAAEVEDNAGSGKKFCPLTNSVKL